MKRFASLNLVSFSPVVTIEPRRRKFHRTIELRIPLPPSFSSSTSQMQSRTSRSLPAQTRPTAAGNFGMDELRLLCSIEEGESRADWKDMTESIQPSQIDDDSLIFPTTISARYWLLHFNKQKIKDDKTLARVREEAAEVYRLLTRVPYMAKFVIFAKRRDINEANVRVFCITDDREERTLEVQEHYSLIARSRDVEVLESQRMYLELGGNLLPVHLLASGFSKRRGAAYKSNSSALIAEQPWFTFHAFQENRLAFAVRVRELNREPVGRIAFMEDSLRFLEELSGEQREFLYRNSRRAICTLGLELPAMCVSYDSILGTPKRNSYYASAHVGELTLAEIANLLDESSDRIKSSRREEEEEERDSLAGDHDDADEEDWKALAPRLGIPRDEVEFILDYCARPGGSAGESPSLLLLMHWYKLAAPDSRDQDMARALNAIGRPDIVDRLRVVIEPKKMSRSTMELLREIERIPVQSHENLYTDGLFSADQTRTNSRLAADSSATRGKELLSSNYNSRSNEHLRAGTEFPDSGTDAKPKIVIVNQEDDGKNTPETNEMDDDKSAQLELFVEDLVEKSLADALASLSHLLPNSEHELTREDLLVADNTEYINYHQFTDDHKRIQTSNINQQPRELLLERAGSPSRQVDGVNILEELNEMARCANRIDSILSNQSHRNLNQRQLQTNKSIQSTDTDNNNSLERHISRQSSLNNKKQRKRKEPDESLEVVDGAENINGGTGSVETGGVYIAGPLSREGEEVQEQGGGYTTEKSESSSAATTAAAAATITKDSLEATVLAPKFQTNESTAKCDAHELQRKDKESNGLCVRECSSSSCGASSCNGSANDKAGNVPHEQFDKTQAQSANERSEQNEVRANKLNELETNFSASEPAASCANPDLDKAIGNVELSTCIVWPDAGYKQQQHLAGDASELSTGDFSMSSTTEDTNTEPTTIIDSALYISSAQEQEQEQEQVQKQERKGERTREEEQKGLESGEEGAASLGADLDLDSGAQNPQEGWSCSDVKFKDNNGASGSSRIDVDASRCNDQDQPNNENSDDLELGSPRLGDIESEESKGSTALAVSNRDEEEQQRTHNSSCAASLKCAPTSEHLKSITTKSHILKEQVDLDLDFDLNVRSEREESLSERHPVTARYSSASSGTISSEDLEEKAELAVEDALILNALNSEKKHSLPEKLKTKNSLLLVDSSTSHSSSKQLDANVPSPEHNSSDLVTSSTLNKSKNCPIARETDTSASIITEFDIFDSEKERHSIELDEQEFFKATDSEHIGQARNSFGGGEGYKIITKTTSSAEKPTTILTKVNIYKSTPTLGSREYQKSSTSNSSQTADQISTSSTYITAPIGPVTSSSSYVDFTTASTSLSAPYETAKSTLTTNTSNQNSTSTLNDNTNTTQSEMVSFSIEDRGLRSSLSQAHSTPEADSPTITPNTEELDDIEMSYETHNIPQNKQTLAPHKTHSPTPSSSQKFDLNEALLQNDDDDDNMDEEQLRRILTCKRLSEGCNRYTSNFVTRKNSLHMIEELPPLTEGETMRHMSRHLSQSIEQSTTSSGSSGSLRISSRPQVLSMKRGSQDENTSCSSSTSLERSPTRRRSSTVSQCSSVLSESTRNQLNFDLSPDLPPDSSLMEANAISPTEFDRPPSPEPSSLDASGGDIYEFRPISRISNEELMLPSPDSTLGDSNDNEIMEEQMQRLTQSCINNTFTSSTSENAETQLSNNELQLDEESGNSLERLIDEVSTVTVSVGKISSKRPAENDDQPSRMSSFGQKVVKSSSQANEKRSLLPKLTSVSIDQPRPPRTNRPLSSTETSTTIRRGRTLNSPHLTANSTCSSPSSSHSTGTNSTARISGNQSGSSGKVCSNKNDDFRLLYRIKMEQRDLNLRQSQCTPSTKSFSPIGHQHDGLKSSGLLCYCHNF